MVLPRSFYQSDDVVQLAQKLLGTTIHSYIDGTHTAGRIVETEAYRAPDDKACHAYANRRTSRTEPMFHEGGVAYIYLCYGIHHLFNVVTGPSDTAHAVLVRAIEPLIGIETMLLRRKKSIPVRNLTAGPGTLSAALGLHRSYSGIPLFDIHSPIQIEEGHSVPPNLIHASPRVGVDYAEECAKWPWRFRVKNSK